MFYKSLVGVPFVVAFACVSSMGWAEDDYNDSGNWQFTDRYHKSQAAFDSAYFELEPEPRVTLRQDGLDTRPVYVLYNDFSGPVEVELGVSNSMNLLTDPPLPARFVLPALAEQTVLGVAPIDPALPFGYKLQYRWVPGKPMRLPVTGLIVHAPFPAGEAFVISQGFDGTSTHGSPEARYAVDIAMPIGTPILAARDGIVMDVVQEFNSGGTDLEKYADRSNRVLILHDDGTMAMYAHIDVASVNVRRGSRVQAGREIARSGNTGFTTGPHLHFAVQQNVGMRLVSLPFRFASSGGRPRVPQENVLLQGTLPAP